MIDPYRSMGPLRIRLRRVSQAQFESTSLSEAAAKDAFWRKNKHARCERGLGRTPFLGVSWLYTV